MKPTPGSEINATVSHGGLPEPASGSGAPVLVTVFDELLSESALAVDWNRPEEDAAWQHLQGAA